MDIQFKDIQRFLSKIKIVGSCWEWTANLNNKGYGQFLFQKKQWKAHRFSYELFYGDLDDTLTIDHLCRNRKCQNPKHLEQVPMTENVLRGNGPTAVNKRKTHCPQGHEYSVENTTILKNGGRRCKICQKAYNHNYKLKLKETS